MLFPGASNAQPPKEKEDLINAFNVLKDGIYGRIAGEESTDDKIKKEAMFAHKYIRVFMN